MANEVNGLEGLSPEEREFVEKIFKLDPVTRGCFKILTTRSVHIENGAMWEVITPKAIKEDEDIEAARSNAQAVQYWGVEDNRVLASVNPNLFFQGMDKVDSELARSYNVAYNQARENAITNLTKRLHRYFKRDLKEGKTTLRLGIFSVNGSPKATAQDGAKIDAYQLDFSMFSNILRSIADEYKTQMIVQVSPESYFVAGQFLPPSTKLVGSKMCREDNALEISIRPFG